LPTHLAHPKKPAEHRISTAIDRGCIVGIDQPPGLRDRPVGGRRVPLPRHIDKPYLLWRLSLGRALPQPSATTPVDSSRIKRYLQLPSLLFVMGTESRTIRLTDSTTDDPCAVYRTGPPAAATKTQ
jgi:hypothetical protein